MNGPSGGTRTEREQRYYDEFYNAEAKVHFAKPAVVAFRKDLAKRIVRATGADSSSKVLSVGCGIGDTELLLAPHVHRIVGIDVSPRAIAQANEDAARQGVTNAVFRAGRWEEIGPSGDRFDVVLAIFFLHHLDEEGLAALPWQLLRLMKPKGVFYSLDPSANRLSGMVGRLLLPKLMKKYQTDDEAPLSRRETARKFTSAGFSVSAHWYDFVSTPLAGLLPGFTAGYRLTRWLDHGLVRVPLVRDLSSNFELIARAP